MLAPEPPHMTRNNNSIINHLSLHLKENCVLGIFKELQGLCLSGNSNKRTSDTSEGTNECRETANKKKTKENNSVKQFSGYNGKVTGNQGMKDSNMDEKRLQPTGL